MNQLQKFNSERFGTVRTLTDAEGMPWFVAKDICDALELTNPTVALSRLDDDERSKFNLGRQGETNMINEHGLYSLILASRKPEAKQFKRWVTHEVLPAIRKHGGYITTQKMEELLQDPDSLIKMLEAIKAERVKNKALTAKIEADKPKTVFADAVAASTQCILVGDLAKILKKNDVKTGQNRLFAWLRENGYLHKTGSRKNMPTQRAMEMGLFEVKETAITHSDGHVSISFTTKVTGKGQQYFINKFLDKKRA